MKRILLLLALAPALVFAQPAKVTPSPEWLLSLNRVGEYAVSPDGKMVVYAQTKMSVTDNKGEKDLYIAATTAPGAPRVLSAEKGAESSPRFSPDGKHIGFLADHNGKTQVWEMNLDGTGKHTITEAASDVDGFLYLPKGGLVYASRVKLDTTEAEKFKDAPKTSARMVEGLMYRHWTQWHDYKYSHLFWLPAGRPASAAADLMPGEKYDCPTPPFGGMEDVGVSPDGRYIIYSSRKEVGAQRALSTNTDLYRVDMIAHQVKNLTEGNFGYDKNPVVSPDGKLLAYTSMEGKGNEADKNRLLVIDLETGANKRDLTAQFEEGVASTPVWAKDGKGLYVPVHQKGTEQIFYFSLDGKAAPKQITTGRQNLPDLALTVPGMLLCTRTAMDAPADLHSLDVKTDKLVNLTNANQQAIANTNLPKVEQRMVKTSDGKEMLVWHILPPNFDASKKYPTLLYCQGGPQSPVSQGFSFRWNFMVLASQGYVVVAPCRRGMPGFGRAWNDDISGDWGGQPMRDYLAAIDDAKTLPYVNGDKLGCVGASYGGYSVFYLAGIHEKRFKAFIAHAGVFDLTSMYGTTEELFFSDHESEGPYWKTPTPKTYTEFSPHLRVGQWDTPMLVIHGGLDFRVPEGQGMEAYTALQARGIPSKFLYFPDEGHWIMKPQNSLVWHREFFAWLDRYLK